MTTEHRQVHGVRIFLHILIGIIAWGCGATAQAGILGTWGTPSPAGAWSYSIKAGLGHGNDTTYLPVHSDITGAVFQGYVTYPVPATYPGTWHGWLEGGAGVQDLDSLYVFTTYLLSSSDMLLDVTFNGDDGHSVFVDNNFFIGWASGMPPPAIVTGTIALTANVPRKLELAVYNGPGLVGITFLRTDNGLSIDTTPGLQLSAVNDFTSAAIPEPASLTIFSVGLAFTTLGGVIRRRKQAA